jgi:hypothetical protein
MQPFLEMEKLFPSGIYYISGAASIAGNLTLDGGGFKFNFFVLRQMALCAAANTNVILTNTS